MIFPTSVILLIFTKHKSLMLSKYAGINACSYILKAGKYTWSYDISIRIVGTINKWYYFSLMYLKAAMAAVAPSPTAVDTWRAE